MHTLEHVPGAAGFPELFAGTGLQQLNFYCEQLKVWVALVPQKTGIDRGAGAVELTPAEFADAIRRGAL